MVRMTIAALALALAGCTGSGSESDDAAEDSVPSGDAAAAEQIVTEMPEAFRGIWDFSEETCGDPASEMRLEIGAGEIRYYESVATPSRIAANSETSLTVDHAFSGEGDEWSETLAYELSPDGERLTVTQIDGSMSIRMRCP